MIDIGIQTYNDNQLTAKESFYYDESESVLVCHFSSDGYVAIILEDLEHRSFTQRTLKNKNHEEAIRSAWEKFVEAFNGDDY